MARSPVAATLSHAAVAPANDRTNDPVALHPSEMRTDGMRAKASRMRKRRPRNPTRFTDAPYETRVTAVSRSKIQIDARHNHPHIDARDDEDAHGLPHVRDQEAAGDCRHH